MYCKHAQELPNNEQIDITVFVISLQIESGRSAGESQKKEQSLHLRELAPRCNLLWGGIGLHHRCDSGGGPGRMEGPFTER